MLDTLIDLPMVFPPTVAGVALLMAFGRRGILGEWFDVVGLHISFTSIAVVLAQSFVSAPFYIRAARAGFQSVDQELERVAYTLGHSSLSTFFRVTVPLAFPALLGGAVMAWARALGEFGATIMFAGNMIGRTQTMPLAIYTAMETRSDCCLSLIAYFDYPFLLAYFSAFDCCCTAVLLVPMLEVVIRKRLADFHLDVAFTANHELVVLFGPSGSGKSLTLRSIAGTMSPDEGRIIIDNELSTTAHSK